MNPALTSESKTREFKITNIASLRPLFAGAG